jgi:hypothetical protein
MPVPNYGTPPLLRSPSYTFTFSIALSRLTMTYLNTGHGTEIVGVSQWADCMLVVADAGEG